MIALVFRQHFSNVEETTLLNISVFLFSFIPFFFPASRWSTWVVRLINFVFSITNDAGCTKDLVYNALMFGCDFEKLKKKTTKKGHNLKANISSISWDCWYLDLQSRHVSQCVNVTLRESIAYFKSLHTFAPFCYVQIWVNTFYLRCTAKQIRVVADKGLHSLFF